MEAATQQKVSREGKKQHGRIWRECKREHSLRGNGNKKEREMEERKFKEEGGILKEGGRQGDGEGRGRRDGRRGKAGAKKMKLEVYNISSIKNELGC